MFNDLKKFHEILTVHGVSSGHRESVTLKLLTTGKASIVNMELVMAEKLIAALELFGLKCKRYDLQGFMEGHCDFNITL
jgi:hypothetical protein